MKVNPIFSIFLAGMLLAGCSSPSQDSEAAVLTLTSIVNEVLVTQAVQLTQFAGDEQATRTAQITPIPTLGVGSTILSSQEGMFMVYVPAGEYQLGSDPQEIDSYYEECVKYDDQCDKSFYEDELPRHKVILDAFWIDQTEVTNAMFTRFVNATSTVTTAERLKFSNVYYQNDAEPQKNASWQLPQGVLSGETKSTDFKDLQNHPVVNVSWYDAWAYCDWAGKRLPTEAEWETAARGPESFIYPWGNQAPDGQKDNMADANLPETRWKNPNIDDGWSRTAPIGSYPAGDSPFAVQNMAGNVREWVYDGYSPDYKYLIGEANPVFTGDVTGRVTRGGSFMSLQIAGHASNRTSNSPLYSADFLGFRCVSSPIDLPTPPPMEDIPQGEVAILDSSALRRVNIKSLPVDGQDLGRIKGTDAQKVQVLAQYDNCLWLRISTPGYPEGWIGGPAKQNEIVLYRPCGDLQEAFFRPDNGDLLLLIPTGGLGVLNVINPETADIFLMLVNTEKPEITYGLYIHGKAQAKLQGIPDGSYVVYYTTGTIWVNYLSRFKDAQSYAKLDQPLQFQTSGTTYAIISLTMQKVGSGNASTSKINPSEFPVP